jgi:lipoprotein-anchoring transpeptidase ErfK/SrfK
MRKAIANFLLILASSALIFILISNFKTGTNDISNPTRLSAAGSSYEADLTGEISSETTAVWENSELEIPAVVLEANEPTVLGLAHEERWIEVDLSEQKLKAWEGSSLFLETPISSGLPATPTPQGEFRIWIKLRATKMSGGSGRNYYYLPNVPYVMYFYNGSIPKYKGYGLHGTYWHNDFGNPRSHGCVNLPTPIAEQLYYWLSPQLPSGKSVVYASAENPGARILIHE